MNITQATAVAAGCAAALTLQSLPSEGAEPALRTTVAPALPAVPAASAQDLVATGGPDGGTTTIAMVPAARSADRSLAGPFGPGTESAVRQVPAQGTRPFSLIGVTWNSPGAELDATVQARTRSSGNGRWSGWQQMPTDSDDAPDGGSAERTGPGSRGATAPLWTGPSDGVQVRVVAGRGNRLPAGLRVDLVDPGTGAQSSAEPRVLKAGGAPTAAERRGLRSLHTSARPRIVTRAGWKANNKWRKGKVQYTGTVRTVFVHHTATGNHYTCSQAPAIIRSIYRYHVKSNGWRDIGYNFLVDKCGNIYEGRAGGISRPVLGAHTLGFNTNTTGIAAIGTFTKGHVPKLMLEAIARLAAWKLGIADRDPQSKATLTSADSHSRYKKGKKVKFRTVAGHRDALATECPGRALFADLSRIRSEAAELQGRRQPRRPAREWDPRPDDHHGPVR